MPIHYASQNKRVRIRGKVIQQNVGGLNLGELGEPLPWRPKQRLTMCDYYFPA
jgi:hypothetical protein